MDASDCGFNEPATGQRPIPSELYSVYESGPFTRCTICSGQLQDRSNHPQGKASTDPSSVYEVQKVFRAGEVLFEMAICRKCGERVAEEFSEESIEAMKGFLLSKFMPDDEGAHCHFCGFPRSVLSGWTILGACRSSQLIFPVIIVCESCSESLQERLSKPTRDLQDEFIRDHFPGVPADIDFSPSVFGV